MNDLAGKTVVLYFYPRDNTPGCTIEACEFRDNFAALKKAGAVVLGVSSDDLKSHAKFIEKQQLNFVLLADTEKNIHEAYGVWGKKKFMGREFMGIVRSTFLIDDKGKIKKIWSPVSVKDHVKEVLENL